MRCAASRNLFAKTSTASRPISSERNRSLSASSRICASFSASRFETSSPVSAISSVSTSLPVRCSENPAATSSSSENGSSRSKCAASVCADAGVKTPWKAHAHGSAAPFTAKCAAAEEKATVSPGRACTTHRSGVRSKMARSGSRSARCVGTVSKDSSSSSSSSSSSFPGFARLRSSSLGSPQGAAASIFEPLMTWHSSICATMSWCGGVPLPASPTNTVARSSRHTVAAAKAAPGSWNSASPPAFLRPAATSSARISTAYRRSTSGALDWNVTVIGRGASNAASMSSNDASEHHTGSVDSASRIDRNVIPATTPFRAATEPSSTSHTCAPVPLSQSYGAKPKPSGPSGKETVATRSETASSAASSPAAPPASPRLARPRLGISPVIRPGVAARTSETRFVLVFAASSEEKSTSTPALMSAPRAAAWSAATASSGSLLSSRNASAKARKEFSFRGPTPGPAPRSRHAPCGKSTGVGNAETRMSSRKYPPSTHTRASAPAIPPFNSRASRISRGHEGAARRADHRSPSSRVYIRRSPRSPSNSASLLSAAPSYALSAGIKRVLSPVFRSAVRKRHALLGSVPDAPPDALCTRSSSPATKPPASDGFGLSRSSTVNRAPHPWNARKRSLVPAAPNAYVGPCDARSRGSRVTPGGCSASS
mmetsp:Transcript_465/g.1920  ORF Transcript_465/g.1920 Transcript_465/m.1920 type:complete len:657 (-) Transcript_465:95-2065(-)